MRKSLLLSTAIGIAMAGPANAESWYLVSSGSEDLFFADADSVTRKDGYLQVRVIDSLYTPVKKTDGGENVYFLNGPMNLNCATRQFQNLGTAGYAAKTQYVAEFDVDSSWQAIGTGTFAESLWKFGCENDFRSEAVTDPFSYAEDYWYYYQYDY